MKRFIKHKNSYFHKDSFKHPIAYKKTKFLKKKLFSYFHNKISEFDISLFLRQLSTLITANIPIVQCCHILSNSQEKTSLSQLINSIKHEIEAGKSLTTGLRKFPAYFDEMICNTLYAGEQTGTLETMLKRVADYKEKALRLKNQITQAIFYPALIFVTAILVSLIMLIFVVPRFAELFQSLHGELPAFTQMVLSLSQLLQEFYWTGCIPLLGLAIVKYYLKTSELWQQYYDHIILKIPLLNEVVKKIILIRFARSLAVTFAAGTSITEALKTVAYICGNHQYQRAVFALKNHVLAGQQLHKAMQLNALFSPMSVQMVKIGEESGTLPYMLEKIADLYAADLDYLISNLTHLLEPLIMIILGVLIGGLVISMYLPIFKLGTII